MYRLLVIAEEDDMRQLLESELRKVNQGTHIESAHDRLSLEERLQEKHGYDLHIVYGTQTKQHGKLEPLWMWAGQYFQTTFGSTASLLLASENSKVIDQGLGMGMGIFRLTSREIENRDLGLLVTYIRRLLPQHHSRRRE